MQLPSVETISTSTLNNIYKAIQVAVKRKLQGVMSICIMMDGWTHKYKARPYLGVRIAFINNWVFEVLTLDCHVMPSHTSRAVSEHVTKLLKKYFYNLKQLYITSCHDCAANMVAASRLLKVDNY